MVTITGIENEILTHFNGKTPQERARDGYNLYKERLIEAFDKNDYDVSSFQNPKITILVGDGECFLHPLQYSDATYIFRDSCYAPSMIGIPNVGPLRSALIRLRNPKGVKLKPVEIVEKPLSALGSVTRGSVWLQSRYKLVTMHAGNVVEDIHLMNRLEVYIEDSRPESAESIISGYLESLTFETTRKLPVRLDPRSIVKVGTFRTRDMIIEKGSTGFEEVQIGTNGESIKKFVYTLEFLHGQRIRNFS